MPEERKLVSILFADVTGFTTISDTLDPEDVRALMSRYYEHAREVITEHGGTLEKFIGDAVMAVFGLLQAHENDAERALAAALALRMAVAEDSLLASHIQLRMGVNTGEVVATNNPQQLDFLITGDAVNIAARLQQGALPGEIMVSERTVQATQNAFLFADPREIIAKGKPQPLRVFPLRCTRTRRQVEHPAFVGRRQDLLQLEILKERVVEENCPQLVSFIAPAGTGKSRLLEEFIHRLPEQDHFQIAFARSLPYGQNLTFWPLRGLLTDLLHTDPSKEQVEAVFLQGDFSANDATRLANLVLASLGIEEKKGVIDHESIFMAWRLLFEVFASRSPLMLIFEDLHWASDNLLAIIDYIAKCRVSASLLIIVLSRPELLDRQTNWVGGCINYTSLSLQPLAEKHTTELVDHAGANIPLKVRQRIVERSGGNPFFALELLHTYTDLEGKKLPTNNIALPDSIHAALLARIDMLGKHERLILQTVSVASRAFRKPMIQALLPELSAEIIDQALSGLLNRELLTKINPEHFVFRHILIRDVAYGTLSRPRRIRLHSQIATWLEQYSHAQIDEYIELIAFHYQQAITISRQSAIPLTLPFEKQDAACMLARAGRQAGQMGSYAQAQHYLQLAIQLRPEDEKMLLYEQLGDSVIWGNIPAGSYKQALKYWRMKTDPDARLGARLIRKTLIANTRMSMFKDLDFTQEYVESLRQEALALLATVEDEDEYWRVRVTACFDPRFHSASLRLQMQTEMRKVREMVKQAIEHFERRDNREALSEALDGYSSLSFYLGELHTSIESSQHRLTIADLPAREWSDAVGVIVMYHWLVGDYEQCVAYAREVLANLRPEQPRASLGYIASYLAHSAYLIGRWDEAQQVVATLDEIRALILYDPGTTAQLIDGYLANLWIALARQDQPRIDALAAILRHDGAQLGEPFLNYLEALLQDAPLPEQSLPERFSDPLLIALFLFLNEHGRPMYDQILQRVWTSTRLFTIYRHLCEVSFALFENDNERLAKAIEQIEAEKLIVYAARMRIVLAQRLRDPNQLACARSTLEQLEDRQYLQKLTEVALELQVRTSE